MRFWRRPNLPTSIGAHGRVTTSVSPLATQPHIAVTRAPRRP